jgi:Mce-associated membrane protein
VIGPFKRKRDGRHALPADHINETAPESDTPIDEAESPSTEAEPVVVDTADEVRNDEGDSGANTSSAPETGLYASRPRRALVYIALPIVAFIAAAAAGYLRYEWVSTREADTAAVESVRAASDGTVAMLSYNSATVDHDLSVAQDRLTGTFRDDYAKLTKETVIPGSKEKNISSVANVAAASSVSASPNHAVVLVFVDQNITIGTDPPSGSSSSVRVTLDRQGDQWLISAFEPV